ncbi:N4-gp56 family major capsid protein [Glaciimonas immobilis]|uniref:N4-gp56 family major capsid protein n=1 Tax=Glaciimonas immobilis TaxID=728004 RepID=A0A840RUN1_9BURK|nr:N4-gp56 family major capsid protein [Glaciimonas immobilis]KAF3997546.1 N4-gp56 family major capsid protein [Glaciimonas immobilis]MBB5200768.1 N4-gp56 family major capsid protein [Glaciimonas immobilis]
MASVNKSASFASDISNYIQKKTLPLAQRQLVAFQFGTPLMLPKNRGTTYTATRYSRINLPAAALSEGVPSVGEIIPISQVSATAQQWGDSVYITDVDMLTIEHDLFKEAMRLTALQLAETLERNTQNALMSGTNIGFANGKATRASLLSTDVLGVTEINKAVGSLNTVGAPKFGARDFEDDKLELDTVRGGGKNKPHYVAVIHPLVEQDLRSNATMATAWSYSDLEVLYNMEVGVWGGVRFTSTNMTPWYQGAAAITGTSSGTGTFTAANYQLFVTETDPVFGYERIIHQSSGNIAMTLNQGLSVTLPTATVSGYTYNCYLSAAAGTTPNTLALCASGPTTGSFTGYATQLAAGTTVLLTGPGPTVASLQASATPSLIAPLPPATGVTVYPTFFIAKGAYGQVTLDSAHFEYLKDADKSDVHNQLRVISWKIFYGTMILNQAFFLRFESGSNYANVITTGAFN